MEKEIIHSKNIREHNKEIIIEELRNHNSLTKANVASIVKLSFPAVSTILDTMLANKQIVCVSKTSSGGRPAEHFSLNPMYYYTLCVYLEKHVLHYQIYDYTKNVITNKEVIVTKDDLKTMVYECNQYIKKYPMITNICFGLPGVFENDIITLMSDYYSLKGIRLRDYFPENINIYVENDVNIIALGYYQRYLFTTPCNYVHILVGDNGPGVGLVMHNQLIKGDFNYAGEIENLTLENTTIKELACNKDTIIRALQHICLIYSAVVNPLYIGISGRTVTKEVVQNITLSFVPKNKQPTLLYVNDIEDIYFNGLLNLIKK